MKLKISNKEAVKFIREDLGDAGAPMATLTNTPGMGDVMMPSSETGGFGSGDKWDVINNISTKAPAKKIGLSKKRKIKKKKRKSRKAKAKK